MSEQVDNPLKESLSALVDGEAGELELRRVLKAGADSEAREVWQRYQIASALIKGECHAPIAAKESTAFSEGVLDAIEAEDKGESVYSDSLPTITSSKMGGAAQAELRWYAGFGKVAIAASVAFAVLLGANQLSLEHGGPVDGSSELASMAVDAHPGDTSAVVPEGYRVPSLSAMTVSAGSAANYRSPVRSLTIPAAPSDGAIEYSPELQAQLQRMLILHSEKATDEVGLTIVPISRLSSQDMPKE